MQINDDIFNSRIFQDRKSSMFQDNRKFHLKGIILLILQYCLVWQTRRKRHISMLRSTKSGALLREAVVGSFFYVCNNVPARTYVHISTEKGHLPRAYGYINTSHVRAERSESQCKRTSITLHVQLFAFGALYLCATWPRAGCAL